MSDTSSIQDLRAKLFDEYAPIEDFAAAIGRNLRTVYRYFDAGLPFTQIGASRLIHVPTAREWIRKQERSPKAPKRRKAA